MSAPRIGPTRAPRASVGAGRPRAWIAVALAGALVLPAGCDRASGEAAPVGEDRTERAAPTPTTTPGSDPADAVEGSTPSEAPDEGATAHDPVRFAIGRIRGAIRREIVGTNWHPGCPVGPRMLRVVTVTYHGFNGETKRGPIVVHRAVADDVLGVFRRLFRHRFPIRNVALPPRYRPNLDAYDRTRSVPAGFNCRPVTDGTSWSRHALGLAIDINPLQNPYVRGDGSVLRRAALPYRNRSRRRPGMIREGDVVVRAFDRIGWGWGGRWSTIKDYMHFSAGGS